MIDTKGEKFPQKNVILKNGTLSNRWAKAFNALRHEGVNEEEFRQVTRLGIVRDRGLGKVGDYIEWTDYVPTLSES